MCTDYLQCLIGLARFKYCVAVMRENSSRDRANIVVIFDEENCFCTCDRTGRLDIGAGGNLEGAWQINDERASSTHFALHPDRTAALLNNAVHGCETKAGPAARLLRRKKRLEQARLRRFVHAGSGVADRQHDVWPFLMPA